MDLGRNELPRNLVVTAETLSCDSLLPPENWVTASWTGSNLLLLYA